MNLFILSKNKRHIAKYMVDKHVSKILLEAVQMLCVANRILDPDNAINNQLYKITHKNHPVSVWCRESRENYIWVLDLIDELHKEWNYRYGHTKIHKSYPIAKILRDNIPKVFPQKGLTVFAMAMDDEYKPKNKKGKIRNTYKAKHVIDSYRRMYKYDKSHIAFWTKRNKPKWWWNTL